jgi:hypothetical protein
MISASRSRYDSLTFDLKRRFGNHFTFGGSYVLSRALTYGGQAQDWGNESQGIYPGLTGWQTQLKGIIGPQNFGYTSEDERHRVVLNGIVEIPGGFTLSGISQLASGRPYTISSGRDLNGDGVANDVYSITGNPQDSIRQRVQLRGDPFFQTDVRVQKAFKFGERMKLSLVADIFNLMNQVNFGNNFQSSARSLGAKVGTPIQQLSREPLGLFGTGNGGVVGIPRQVQLGLKFSF